MTGYNIVNLQELTEEVGENRVKEILSNFSCPLNKDVEYFLQRKAIEFARQGIGQTHLVFTSYKNDIVLIGYFALAMKDIFVSNRAHINNRWKQRLKRFATNEESIGGYRVPAPLIGQLGKNFFNGYNKLISGDELLKIALDKVKETQLIIGGKFVYLECEDKTPLVNFYTQNGFLEFGHRNLEKDERDSQSGEYLVQLLKYMG